MTKKIRQRSLEVIAKQLATVMKREAGEIIAIGGLLLEAKAQLEHGEWLPWLKENFGSSVQTAENYMNAARLAAKIPNVVNLKLRPTALYLLGGEIDDDFYSRKVIRGILKAAETEWINDDRAYEIALSLQPPPPPQPPMPRPKEKAEAVDQGEIDDILDGPPPELPPAPEATPRDVHLEAFDHDMASLAQLQTKPLSTFVATTQPHRLRAIITFLQEVADAIERRATAQPQEQNQ